MMLSTGSVLGLFTLGVETNLLDIQLGSDNVNVVSLLDLQLVSDNVVNHFRLQKEPKKCKCLSVCLAHYTLLGWNYLHMLDYSKFTLLKF